MDKETMEMATELRKLSQQRVDISREEFYLKKKLEKRCYDLTDEERTKVAHITGDIGFTFLHAQAIN